MTKSVGNMTECDRREQLDRIWQYICDLPILERQSHNNVIEADLINERLKLIETILKNKREEQSLLRDFLNVLDLMVDCHFKECLELP